MPFDRERRKLYLKEYNKKYRSKPENKIKFSDYNKKYNAKPEAKQKRLSRTDNESRRGKYSLLSPEKKKELNEKRRLNKKRSDESAEKSRAYYAEYRKKNRSGLLDYHKEWSSKNREKIKEKRKRYLKTNRALVILSKIESKKKRAGIEKETDITSEWLGNLWDDTTHCILCGKKLEDHGKYPDGRQLDHILPLCVGGKHVKINVRYICAKCNNCRPRDGRDLNGT